MQAPPPTAYEKWAVPGSIGDIPPGTTPLNKINSNTGPSMPFNTKGIFGSRG